MRISALAACMCAEPKFQEWLDLFMNGVKPRDVESAARALRFVCQVASRRELDSNEAAAERFHDMRRHYIEWRDQQQPQRRTA